jgi:hypothetical protein
VLRNFEGYITTYEEPISYQPHDPTTCTFCLNQHDEGRQTGVWGLLKGDQLAIKPERFDEVHARGVETPPFKADEITWKPLAIGKEEPDPHGTPAPVTNVPKNGRLKGNGRRWSPPAGEAPPHGRTRHKKA